MSANVETIKSLYEAFGRGDVDEILAKLTDDVAWYTHLSPEAAWAGDFSGKSNVPRFFKAIYEESEVLGFSPTEFYEDGNVVVSLGEFHCIVKKTGKESKARWAFIWKFRDGLVSSYEQFHGPELDAAFRG